MSKKDRWYVESSPRLGNAFRDFHQTVTNDSSLDQKTIELIKIAVSSVLRCQHCTEDHIIKAKKEGATKQEIADTLLITSLQGAGTQLYWAEGVFQKHLGN
jgi:AhpD family alkylhydroperoxidase